MDLGIEDRVAVVTGGSVGIGFACAHELLDNGARVLIIARGSDRLEAAEAALRARFDGAVASLAVDVAQEEAAERIVDAARAQFGSLDILINNAGRAQAGGLLTASDADWHAMTELKLTAMRRLCKAAIPLMRAQRWGRIVNMSSIGGVYPNPKLLVSHALSAAINNLTKSLALEVAADGILANAVAIGAVATENWSRNMTPAVRRSHPEWSSLSDDEVLARIAAELTPVGRAGKPEEIGAIAAFLASARNGFITGAVIEASGGADRFL